MNLPRRPDVDPAALLTRLAPQLSGATLLEVGEGFDNVAYAVTAGSGARLLLRVSKFADPHERERVARKDVELLAFVGRHSSLPTNEVVAADTAMGALLMTEVVGTPADQVRPTDPDGFAAAMGAFLTRLHSAPVVEAAQVVGPDERSPEQWLEQTGADWESSISRVPSALLAPVREFLGRPAPAEPRRLAFCHNDLGDEHVVLSEDGRTVRGVIDWSDAILGDPARDLALLAFDFGPATLDAVLTGYAGPSDPALRGRSLWWGARAGVEGLAWRVANDRPWQVTAERLRAILAVQS